MDRPKIGATYKHFKGNLYKVIDIVRNSETNEEMVLYDPIETNKDFPDQIWVRPLKMFMKTIVSKSKRSKKIYHS